MRKIKILNLYACLGGNRYKWDEVGEEAGLKSSNRSRTRYGIGSNVPRSFSQRHGCNCRCASISLDHYKEFDFIWSSPPCPSHSRARYWGFGINGRQPIYPDLNLYQEIIFLKTHFKGNWVVENVIPYYRPLIPAQERGRHLYWTNLKLPKILSNRKDNGLIQESKIGSLSKYHDYDFSKYKGNQRVLKIARNLVDYEAGKTILQTALNVISDKPKTQQTLF